MKRKPYVRDSYKDGADRGSGRDADAARTAPFLGCILALPRHYKILLLAGGWKRRCRLRPSTIPGLFRVLRALFLFFPRPGILGASSGRLYRGGAGLSVPPEVQHRHKTLHAHLNSYSFTGAVTRLLHWPNNWLIMCNTPCNHKTIKITYKATSPTL